MKTGSRVAERERGVEPKTLFCRCCFVLAWRIDLYDTHDLAAIGTPNA